MSEPGLIGALDMGERNFTVLAGRGAGSALKIAGYGVADARGFAGGQVTDVNAAAEAVQAAVRQAEVMAGGSLDGRLVCSVGGDHLDNEVKKGHVKIQGGDVNRADVDLALDTLQAFPIPSDRRVLHVIERAFFIDGRSRISNPLGMSGQLLEVEALVVTAADAAIANLESCLAKAGVRPLKFMSAALAAGFAVTTKDEREMGVLALDWGAGTCDYVRFSDEAALSFGAERRGGIDIDRDIAKIFTISLASARMVKERIGSAEQVPVDNESCVEVKDADGVSLKPIEPHVLSMAISPRVDEMVDQLRKRDPDMFNKDALPAGIVIAGGMAQLAGLVSVLASELNLKVRAARPQYAGPHADEVANSEFATCFGLLQLWSGQEHAHQELPAPSPLRWLRSLFGGRDQPPPPPSSQEQQP